MITKKKEQSSETKVQRRKGLKAIASGATATLLLPADWTKPIISSVLLPAHAPDVCTEFVYFLITGIKIVQFV